MENRFGLDGKSDMIKKRMQFIQTTYGSKNRRVGSADRRVGKQDLRKNKIERRLGPDDRRDQKDKSELLREYLQYRISDHLEYSDKVRKAIDKIYDDVNYKTVNNKTLGRLEELEIEEEEIFKQIISEKEDGNEDKLKILFERFYNINNKKLDVARDDIRQEYRDGKILESEYKMKRIEMIVLKLQYKIEVRKIQENETSREKLENERDYYMSLLK